MSSIFTELGGIAKSSAGEALAFGLGFALGRVLDPVGTELVQEAWKEAPIRAPDAGPLAAGVAQGQVDEGKAREWASEHGYSADAFGALVNIANTGPALGYAYQAWRRGQLTDAEFDTALRRTGLETQWDTAMRALHDELLEPQAIATAIHRGIIAGQGLLIAEPPQGDGRVPHVPQSTLDGVKEAAGHGITSERLRILVGNTGLPLALGEMLQLLNRGEVTEDDVRRAVAQSNVRNEYMDVAINLRRRLLTPHEYEEAALRGIIPESEADAGAALSGMEQADARLLFDIMGRPLPVRAITTGLARGATLGGTYDDVPEPYRDAIRRSNIRPEYARLAYANRYSYPSAFVLRSLVQTGAITEAEAHDVLLRIGWEPDFAALVAKAWAGGTTTKGDPHVGKAETQLWTALHKAYVIDEADDAIARETLTLLGVADAAVPDVLRLWDAERTIVRLSLTPTQIKKAYAEAKFTRDVALQRLEQLGMTPADAATLLDE